MMFWYGVHWTIWQAGLMWAAMILFWVLLIWGIYVLISGTARRPGGGDRGEARHILDERLASGEIDPEEYRRLRGLIGPEGSSTPLSSERVS